MKRILQPAPGSAVTVQRGPTKDVIDLDGSLLPPAFGVQTANYVFAGPTTGSPATPTFRALVNADFPTSGVSAGAYTNANVTVNAQGIITAIANGSAGGGSVAVVTDSSTARVAALTDADKLIEFTNAAAITYTIPPQSSVAWAADTVLYAAQGSTGQVTFVAGSGVTIETPDTLNSRAQESIIGVKRMSADVWEAFGDLEGYITAASVLGRSAATNGAPAAIASSADGETMVRRSGALAWADLRQTAGSTTTDGWLAYNGTTPAAGKLDGSSSAPTNTTRLNYDGYFYATKFFGDGSGLTGTAASVGAQIGYARTVSTTTASTNDTSIPNDGTIPQSGEGVAYAALDTTITPSSASSLLEIEVVIPFAGINAAAAIRHALFRDSGANAIVATATNMPSGSILPLILRVVVAAGSTSATTFKWRWCVSSGTGYLLNYTGTNFFGAANVATMTVREIKQ